MEAAIVELTITEEQRRHLAFTVLRQVESLVNSYEAHEPEVQAAIAIFKPCGSSSPAWAKVVAGSLKNSLVWISDDLYSLCSLRG